MKREDLLFPLRDEVKTERRPYVNYGLLLINTIVFFYFLSQGTYTLKKGIWSLGSIPSDILNGEKLWTLFTSMFMHADIIHLLGNMIYLWVFGDNVEDALGHIKYLIFYFCGGLSASLIHIASLFVTIPSLGNAGFQIPAVGASGAISAVLGAYLFLYPKARVVTILLYFPRIIAIPAYWYLGFWFIYQLIMGVVSLTGLPSGVAFWAHIGGFAAGLLVTKALGVSPRPVEARPEIRKPLRPLIEGFRFEKPLVDAFVEGDRVKVLADIPGAKLEDVEIGVTEWEVAISTKNEENSLSKRITLPAPVLPQIRDLSYKNGVISFYLHRKGQSSD